jgi:hypothetical protein
LIFCYHQFVVELREGFSAANRSAAVPSDAGLKRLIWIRVMPLNASVQHQGFAWIVRRDSGPRPADRGSDPFEGIALCFRPLTWRVETSDPKREAYLLLSPDATFGPRQVGAGWKIAPAQSCHQLRVADGRLRLIGSEPHQTRWGTLWECEFEAAGA